MSTPRKRHKKPIMKAPPQMSVFADYLSRYPLTITIEKAPQRNDHPCPHRSHVTLRFQGDQVTRTVKMRWLHIDVGGSIGGEADVLRILANDAFHAVVSGKEKRMRNFMLAGNEEPKAARFAARQAFKIKRALRDVLPIQAFGQLLVITVQEPVLASQPTMVVMDLNAARAAHHNAPPSGDKPPPGADKPN